MITRPLSVENCAGLLTEAADRLALHQDDRPTAFSLVAAADETSASLRTLLQLDVQSRFVQPHDWALPRLTFTEYGNIITNTQVIANISSPFWQRGSHALRAMADVMGRLSLPILSATGEALHIEHASSSPANDEDSQRLAIVASCPPTRRMSELAMLVLQGYAQNEQGVILIPSVQGPANRPYQYTVHCTVVEQGAL